MPAARKTPSTPRAAAARERAEEDARRLEHITLSLEAAQNDLAAIGDTLGTGVTDLRRDVNRLLRDARRDVTKMHRALQRDIDHLQRDLTSAATARPPARRAASTAARTRTAASTQTARRPASARTR